MYIILYGFHQFGVKQIWHGGHNLKNVEPSLFVLDTDDMKIELVRYKDLIDLVKKNGKYTKTNTSEHIEWNKLTSLYWHKTVYNEEWGLITYNFYDLLSKDFGCVLDCGDGIRVDLSSIYKGTSKFNYMDTADQLKNVYFYGSDTSSAVIRSTSGALMGVGYVSTEPDLLLINISFHSFLMLDMYLDSTFKLVKYRFWKVTPESQHTSIYEVSFTGDLSKHLSKVKLSGVLNEDPVKTVITAK